MNTQEQEWNAPAGWRVVWAGRVPYREMLARQEALVAEKIREPDHTPDTLLLLEHEPVYTIGRTPDRSSLASVSALPYPVETVHRGGQATYHGPGQLVGYPIVDLSRRARDLHRYLRALEEVLMQTLRTYAIASERRNGLTGVWIGQEKIASIGVGVRRWVTLHGFALNVLGGKALEPFAAITPCGLPDIVMTAAQAHTAQALTVEAVAATVAGIFTRTLDAQLSVKFAPGPGE